MDQHLNKSGGYYIIKANVASIAQSKHFIPRYVREDRGKKVIFRRMKLLDYISWLKTKFR